MDDLSGRTDLEIIKTMVIAFRKFLLLRFLSYNIHTTDENTVLSTDSSAKSIANCMQKILVPVNQKQK